TSRLALVPREGGEPGGQLVTGDEDALRVVLQDLGQLFDRHVAAEEATRHGPLRPVALPAAGLPLLLLLLVGGAVALEVLQPLALDGVQGVDRQLERRRLHGPGLADGRRPEDARLAPRPLQLQRPAVADGGGAG